MTRLTIRDLRQDKAVARDLEYHYDFNVSVVGKAWVGLEGARVEPLADDASGGIFATCFIGATPDSPST